jgi:elongation factor G
MSELSGYQTRLNALTRGEGRYTLTLSHHEPVPPATQAEMVRTHRVSDED